MQQSGLPCKQLFRDRDGKFQCDFDAIIAARGVDVRKCPIRSPNLRAHVERWIQSIRIEYLDHFIACGERHRNYLVREYVTHFHEERPHQGEGLDNAPLSGPVPVDDIVPAVLESGCRERLGGILKHYYRRAA